MLVTKYLRTSLKVYKSLCEIKLTFVRTFSLTVIRRTGYIVQKVTEIKFPLEEQSNA